jgi:hypothetical protein
VTDYHPTARLATMRISAVKAAWVLAFACLVLSFGFEAWRASQQPLQSVVVERRSAQIADVARDSRPAAYVPEESTEFWPIFGHRLKITDTLLAIFTLLLVLVGFRQEWWMRKHERAYVIGGPGKRQYLYLEGQPEEEWPVIGIVITAGNYGRTPAFLKHISVGLCPVTHWPPTLYPPFIVCEDVLYPNYERQKVDEIATIPISGNDEQVCYGRIVYDDVFGREHWSSWKHLIHADRERSCNALPGSYTTGWDYNWWQRKMAPP